MSDEPENAGAAPAPPAKRGGLKVALFIALPLALGAGVGAWWLLGGSSATAAAQPEVRLEERGLVPFETFLVNLSDPGGNRFLKVNLKLVLSSSAEAKHMEESDALMSHARSAILELLTEQNAQALVTAEGKQKLKERLKSHLSSILVKQKVVDVLFAEFVVQF